MDLLEFLRLRLLGRCLLDGAADLGEYVVGIRSDESNRADNDDQNYSQHYSVFGDILAFLFAPESAHKLVQHAYLLETQLNCGNGFRELSFGTVLRPDHSTSVIIPATGRNVTNSCMCGEHPRVTG